MQDPAQPRALVVDDDDSVGRMIGRILFATGFEVLVVASAYDALALFEKGERFHLVVSDIQMPGLDGFGLLESARRCWPEIDAVVVFVTGGNLTPPKALPCFEKPLRAAFVEHARLVALRVRDLEARSSPDPSRLHA